MKKMKKDDVIAIIIIVLILALIVGVLWTAVKVDLKANNYTKLIEQQVGDKTGNVRVFKVSITTGKEPIEYIKFLENFDESKYEIIDISITDHSNVTRYYVTYKEIN